MEREFKCVGDFNKKLQVSLPQEFPTRRLEHLDFISIQLGEIAHGLEKIGKEDERFNRVHLIVEETSELASALAAGDEIFTFDAIIDLLYVIIGIAVTYNFPITDGFNEVHRSNMTKEKQPHDPSSQRVRDKGPNYSPPELGALLRRHRAR